MYHAITVSAGATLATISWGIVVVGEAVGSGVTSAPLRAPRWEASLHAELALDIRQLPAYAHVL